MVAVVASPPRPTRRYGTPLGDLGPAPSLACQVDLHMNCKGLSIGRRRGQCTCECHDPAADYR